MEVTQSLFVGECQHLVFTVPTLNLILLFYAYYFNSNLGRQDFPQFLSVGATISLPLSGLCADDSPGPFLAQLRA